MMFSKKKMYFWRLAFIFTGITILTLTLLWSSPNMPTKSLKNVNMSDMMKKEHAGNTTIYTLFKNKEQSSEMDEMVSHHQDQTELIIKANFLTTAITFLSLPFIIGGSVLLSIVWKK